MECLTKKSLFGQLCQQIAGLAHVWFWCHRPHLAQLIWIVRTQRFQGYAKSWRGVTSFKVRISQKMSKVFGHLSFFRMKFNFSAQRSTFAYIMLCIFRKVMCNIFLGLCKIFILFYSVGVYRIYILSILPSFRGCNIQYTPALEKKWQYTASSRDELENAPPLGNLHPYFPIHPSSLQRIITRIYVNCKNYVF